MPIYGYHCTECGYEFEIMQSMSAAPLATCPQCNGPLRKLLYPVGVQFKGSGFYTTDYKNGSTGSKGANGSKKDSESKPESTTSKSDSSSETKASDSSSSDAKGD